MLENEGEAVDGGEEQPEGEKPAQKPITKRFRRAFTAVRPEPEMVARQGRITSDAFKAFGGAPAAMSFLNTHDDALGGRPIDVAGASEEGFRTVTAAIAAQGPAGRLSAEAAPHLPTILDAHRTLCRGTRFLAGRASWFGDRARDRVALPPRVIGNGLRELDQFLGVLVDAFARSEGIDTKAGGHRTAQQLGYLRGRLGVDDPDHDRLRALARSRSCLFYSGGRIVRGDARGGASMTSGWHRGAPGASPLREHDVGGTLEISSDDLAEVCGYYRDVAGRLLATWADRPERG